MLIYYSGEENLGKPEIVLGDRANIMLTYFKQQKKLDRRFKAVLKARKRKEKKRASKS